MDQFRVIAWVLATIVILAGLGWLAIEKLTDKVENTPQLALEPEFCGGKPCNADDIRTVSIP